MCERKEPEHDMSEQLPHLQESYRHLGEVATGGIDPAVRGIEARVVADSGSA